MKVIRRATSSLVTAIVIGSVFNTMATLNSDRLRKRIYKGEIKTLRTKDWNIRELRNTMNYIYKERREEKREDQYSDKYTAKQIKRREKQTQKYNRKQARQRER